MLSFASVVACITGGSNIILKALKKSQSSQCTEQAKAKAKAELNEKYQMMLDKYHAKFSSGGKCEPRIFNKLKRKEERIAKDIEYLEQMQEQLKNALIKFELAIKDENHQDK